MVNRIEVPNMANFRVGKILRFSRFCIQSQIFSPKFLLNKGFMQGKRLGIRQPRKFSHSKVLPYTVSISAPKSKETRNEIFDTSED